MHIAVAILLSGGDNDPAHRESENSVNYYLESRFLRDRYNLMDLSNQKFLESFRVSKDIFNYLLIHIKPRCKSAERVTKISVEARLAAVLNFYATGSYQRTVGDVLLHNMDQSVISRSVSEITQLLEATVCQKYIKFPDGPTKAINKQRFFEKYNHPGVIGCIDCTHINILAPCENEHIFVDRRGNHSMNVQLICNYDLLIHSVCARFPGSTHDSAIWQVPRDRRKLQEDFANGERNTWLLGDSGYPLELFLMTPYRNPSERQTLYNTLHAKTRNPIERCIGVLKNTFRCLLGERVLRYEPAKVVKIVNVCAALYNICLLNKLEMVNLPRPTEESAPINETEFEYDEIINSESAEEIRNSLLNCF